jgi:hypothetical protein
MATAAVGTVLELGLLGSSAAEGCCCPGPHPVLLTSLDPAASSNSGVVCRSCGRTPRRPSATLGLLFGTVVEPSRGDVSFCHVCARGTGQPDTAVGQCLDQEQKAHAGLIMFCSIVKTLLLLRDRAVHARARRMTVAHATRTHVGIIPDSASRSSSRHILQVPFFLPCQHSPILLRG